MGEHKLEITFSKDDLGKKEKKKEKKKDEEEDKKKDKKEELVQHVCALMNSGGGTLSLRFTNVTVDQKIRDDIVGRLEKRFEDILTTSQIVENFKIREQTKNSLTLRITASFMVTLCYNLYLPTETQVIDIRRSTIESHSEVKMILERKMFEVNHDKVPESFTFGESSGLQESQTVQLKNLESEQTPKITFADRVIRNKCTKYVSAFANHRGGRIYYGINDDGKVEGEHLTKEEKDEVKRRVKDKINKMKWNRVEPQEDKHWSMEFKPVIDHTGKFIQLKFVMIIYIAPCLGGVFTNAPESYYIEQGEVKKVEFNDWLVHFKMSRQPWPISFTPRHVSSCVPWSSAHQRKVYLQFTTLLVQFRNDNSEKEFTRLRRLAEREPPNLIGTSAFLVVISEAVAVEYKKWRFDEAYELLKKISEMIAKRSQDEQFHIVKMLYLKSRIERAEGEYDKSYETAKRYLNELEKIPAEFITVWYYMHLAMLANTIGARANDPEMFLEAQQWLNLAFRHAAELDDFPGGFTDLHQKLQIYQAMTLLRSSLTGEVSDECVDPGDVEAATTILCSAYNSLMRGNRMTIYREIQLLFGQCSIYLRRSQLSKIRVKRMQYLEHALMWARRAGDLANECNFKDMESYAAMFQRTIKKFQRSKFSSE